MLGRREEYREGGPHNVNAGHPPYVGGPAQQQQRTQPKRHDVPHLGQQVLDGFGGINGKRGRHHRPEQHQGQDDDDRVGQLAARNSSPPHEQGGQHAARHQQHQRLGGHIEAQAAGEAHFAREGQRQEQQVIENAPLGEEHQQAQGTSYRQQGLRGVAQQRRRTARNQQQHEAHENPLGRVGGQQGSQSPDHGLARILTDFTDFVGGWQGRK